MAVQSHQASLKYHISGASESCDYTLSGDATVVIGQDPGCQIVLDSNLYRGVSRRHAELRPLIAKDGSVQWQLHDLHSANGVWVNGQIVQVAQTLQNGDCVRLGQSGFEFIFTAPDPSLQSNDPTEYCPAPVAETVYEPSLMQSTEAAKTPRVRVLIAKSGRSYPKIMGGLLAGIAIFYFLNSPPQSSDPFKRAAITFCWEFTLRWSVSMLSIFSVVSVNPGGC